MLGRGTRKNDERKHQEELPAFLRQESTSRASSRAELGPEGVALAQMGVV